MTSNVYGERLVDPLNISLFTFLRLPQLYDICIARDSPYFVVTNYYGWVFGVFSKGMQSKYFHAIVKLN
jgi:hypothetical protein